MAFLTQEISPALPSGEEPTMTGVVPLWIHSPRNAAHLTRPHPDRWLVLEGDRLSASFLALSYSRLSLRGFWTVRVLGYGGLIRLPPDLTVSYAAEDLLTFPSVKCGKHTRKTLQCGAGGSNCCHRARHKFATHELQKPAA